MFHRLVIAAVLVVTVAVCSGCPPARWAIAQEREAQERYQSMSPEARAQFDRKQQAEAREKERDLQYRRELVRIENQGEHIKALGTPGYHPKIQQEPMF